MQLLKETVECQICKNHFKAITKAHLTTHKLTLDEYKTRFPKCETVNEKTLAIFSRKRSGKIKTQRNETNSVQCKICNEFHGALTLHIRKHDLTPKEYLEKFPGSEIFSETIKQKMKDNSFMKNNAGTGILSYENRFSKELAETLKLNISNQRKSEKGKKSQAQREKQSNSIKAAWAENYESWSAAIKNSSSRQEVRNKMSESQKARIARDGYHLARGKETKLEKMIRTILEELGHTVIKQRGSKKKTLGSTRFFDMFIPELNLIIEADGEYWHQREDRIQIDKEKTEAALLEGYNFLRFSDKEFKKSETYNRNLIISQLSWDVNKQLEKSNKIIKDRETFLGLD